MAQEALSNQAVCKGRFTLGLGTSHHWIIEDMLGLAYERPAQQMRNYLDVLNAALSGPGSVDVENDGYRVHSPIDQTDRLGSAAPLGHYSGVVVATNTVTAALADWREQTRFLVIAATLAAAVIALILFLIIRQISRQNREAQQRLEDAAHPALAAAGFAAAAPGATPDVLVQIGARVTRYERSPWDDPLWLRGGFGRWGPRPWVGPYPYWYRNEPPRYDREVALLLRDRANGAPLYEARATTEGTSSGGDELLSAMFKAAMTDFPKSGSVPHTVSVKLSER